MEITDIKQNLPRSLGYVQREADSAVLQTLPTQLSKQNKSRSQQNPSKFARFLLFYRAGYLPNQLGHRATFGKNKYDALGQLTYEEVGNTLAQPEGLGVL